MIDLTIRSALLAHLSDLGPGDRIAVGLSGGADSVALVRAAVHVGQELSLSVTAIVIDHQLQKSSHDVATRAVVMASELGCTQVVMIPVDVQSGPGSGGLESAARDARRTAFEFFAQNNDIKAVLLGHTRDDQAETVLLGLARGSGARSLSGMRSIEGLYRRPLLALSREQVRATVHDLDIYEDPHNSETRFARVRVRESSLPTLERDLGPGVAAALARTADMLREDADALDVLAHKSSTDGIEELAALLPAVRYRVLRELAISQGANQNDLTRDHVLAIDALITNWHGQGPLNLPGSLNCERQGGKLMFYRTHKE